MYQLTRWGTKQVAETVYVYKYIYITYFISHIYKSYIYSICKQENNLGLYSKQAGGRTRVGN